jgi:hypothetical protein
MGLAAVFLYVPALVQHVTTAYRQWRSSSLNDDELAISRFRDHTPMHGDVDRTSCCRAQNRQFALPPGGAKDIDDRSCFSTHEKL